MSLEVVSLAKMFSGVQAVSDVSFQVQPGECVALIGPNGAGKSTTFACIAGQHVASSGDVIWNGTSMGNLSAVQRLRCGIARTFQVAQVFDALSVLDNVQLACHAASSLPAFNQLKRLDSDAATRLLQWLGLAELAQAIAGQLPYGAKKRLELAIALAGLPPPERCASRLLLLDEPAAGLAAAERRDLMALIRNLSRPSESDESPWQGGAGLAVLYTEHNMDAVFGVADRVLVLMEGRLVAQGSPAEVAGNPTVRARYLGQAFQYREPHAKS